MKNFNEMGKMELRAECKEAGIKNYSKMTVGTMRELLTEYHTPATVEVAEEVPAEPEAFVVGEFTYCPHCGTHLDNGVQDFENMLENHKSQSEIEPITHEFMCLACGEEFGEECELPVKGTGVKIEKDRPEQNGVKRPSAGGKCRAIWDHCDELYAQGLMPKPKLLKEAAEQFGWNPNNAVIEMYQWRKFQGIIGRQA